jgi:hypothetical protein
MVIVRACPDNPDEYYVVSNEELEKDGSLYLVHAQREGKAEAGKIAKPPKYDKVSSAEKELPKNDEDSPIFKIDPRPKVILGATFIFWMATFVLLLNYILQLQVKKISPDTRFPSVWVNYDRYEFFDADQPFVVTLILDLQKSGIELVGSDVPTLHYRSCILFPNHAENCYTIFLTPFIYNPCEYASEFIMDGTHFRCLDRSQDESFGQSQKKSFIFNTVIAIKAAVLVVVSVMYYSSYIRGEVKITTWWKFRSIVNFLLSIVFMGYSVATLFGYLALAYSTFAEPISVAYSSQ